MSKSPDLTALLARVRPVELTGDKQLETHGLLRGGPEAARLALAYSYLEPREYDLRRAATARLKALGVVVDDRFRREAEMARKSREAPEGPSLGVLCGFDFEVAS